MKEVFTVLVFLITAITTQQAYASDFGCTVLLCLANPVSNGGATGIAECVPPINRLYEDLLSGRPFPSCALADGNDGSSNAKQVFDYYDPCHPPLSAAPAGTFVAQGTKKSPQSERPLIGANAYQLSDSPKISESPAGASGRACVANPVGSYIARQNGNGVYQVDVYSTVQWMRPQSPRAIDVYVSGQFYQRVRY